MQVVRCVLTLLASLPHLVNGGFQFRHRAVPERLARHPMGSLSKLAMLFIDVGICREK